jgi:hypothetical protein
MDPAELIDHPPRDDDQGGPVDLVGPVLSRIRAEPTPAPALPGLPLLAVLMTMLCLALGLEWLTRQADVRHLVTALQPTTDAVWSFGDLGVVLVVLTSVVLLLGRRVSA